jgi:hypothetical protein
MKEFRENWDDALVRQPIWFEFVDFNYSYYGSTEVNVAHGRRPWSGRGKPLRQEVELVVAVEGWTKAGMDKMHNIDSFVLETQRIDGPIISRSNTFPLPQHSH